MKSLIVSAFPGCGKTFFVNITNGKYGEYSVVDKDNGSLSTDIDYSNYANEIIDLIGKFDIIFITQYPEVLSHLNKNGYKCVIVAPNNTKYCSKKSKSLIKQQWFGRFTIRKNTNDWIDLLNNNYEEWTSLSHLQAMQPSEIILLNQNEYISDIIEDLIDFFNKID